MDRIPEKATRKRRSHTKHQPASLLREPEEISPEWHDVASLLDQYSGVRTFFPARRDPRDSAETGVRLCFTLQSIGRGLTVVDILAFVRRELRYRDEGDLEIRVNYGRVPFLELEHPYFELSGNVNMGELMAHLRRHLITTQVSISGCEFLQ